MTDKKLTRKERHAAMTARVAGTRLKSSGIHVRPEISDFFMKMTDDDWAQIPEAVREEIWRGIFELADGEDKYKDIYAVTQSVQKYDDMAKASGTTLAAALEKYVAIETQWRSDLVMGFCVVAQNFGVTPRQLFDEVVKGLPEVLANQQTYYHAH